MYGPDIRQSARAEVKRGRSLKSVADELGVSRAAVRDWLARPDLDPPGCPTPVDPTPHYAALFGFYLGDGCISRHPRTYSLRVACDRTLPGIVDDVDLLIRTIHPQRRSYRVPGPGVTVVQSYWKHWPCLFPQHGPGRKHERKLALETWQRDIVEAYPSDFLRGLFHSDGSLVKNWATRMVQGEKKRYEYPRWQFVNESRDIMRWCGEALDLLAISYRQTKPRVLSVSRREDVARLSHLIGVKS